MKVLLSIKPEFANQIFNGTKRFEFRKAVFKREDVDSVLVYASSPVQRVIGEFQVDEIIADDLESVWAQTQKYAGISYDYYKSYFRGRDCAYAIKVASPQLFQRKRKLSHYNIDVAPQSFVYVR
jgi:predicted transcriptional regulator